MLIAVFDDAAARTANAYHSKTGTPRDAAPHRRSDGAGKRGARLVIQERQGAQA